MRHFALMNPELCAQSGGISLLIDSITDPDLEKFSEPLIYTILYLLGHNEYRNMIRVYLDLTKLFSIFTNIYMKTQ